MEASQSACEADRPADREQRAARNLLLQAELVRLVRALRLAGIETIVLKGLPLLRRLYGALDERWMADNDLLVHRADVFRARDVLVELGYRLPRFLRLESQLDLMHAYRLRRPLAEKSFLDADLHWTITLPRLVDVPEECLWAHVEMLELGGERVRVFDPQMTILHLAWHFAVDYFANDKTLADLVRAWSMWGEQIDPDELVRLADRMRLRHVLAYALACVRHEGGAVPAVPEIDSRIARLVLRLVPPERRRIAGPWVAYRRIFVRALMADPRRWPRFLRHALFPPIDEMAEVLGRPVTPGLYLRYLTRPLQPVTRWLEGRGP